MYGSRSHLILGFHGCEQAVRDRLVLRQEELKASRNKYDWLGHGIYFWENDIDRAIRFAKSKPKIKKPAVLGAVIDLGYCLDFLEVRVCQEFVYKIL